MIRADYLCPKHGHFEVEVESPCPDVFMCPIDDDCHVCQGQPSAGGVSCHLCDGKAGPCGHASPWSPTAMHGKVKAFEVVRGKWEKPERKSWLDTRELGEGQDPEDFRAKRRAIRDEERKKAVMEMLK